MFVQRTKRWATAAVKWQSVCSGSCGERPPPTRSEWWWGISLCFIEPSSPGNCQVRESSFDVVRALTREAHNEKQVASVPPRYALTLGTRICWKARKDVAIDPGAGTHASGEKTVNIVHGPS